MYLRQCSAGLGLPYITCTLPLSIDYSIPSVYGRAARFLLFPDRFGEPARELAGRTSHNQLAQRQQHFGRGPGIARRANDMLSEERWPDRQGREEWKEHLGLGCGSYHCYPDHTFTSASSNNSKPYSEPGKKHMRLGTIVFRTRNSWRLSSHRLPNLSESNNHIGGPED